MVQYCTTCPWRRCISQERLFSFNKICICRRKRHEYTYVQHDNDGNYSFICKKCNQRHNLKLTRPLQFYCMNDAKRKSETYHKWNRPSLEFCVHCLSHKIGRNIGFCWFCTNCKKHQLQLMTGATVVLYNENQTMKNGGKFLRCTKCTKLIITYGSNHQHHC